MVGRGAGVMVYDYRARNPYTVLADFARMLHSRSSDMGATNVTNLELKGKVCLHSLSVFIFLLRPATFRPRTLQADSKIPP